MSFVNGSEERPVGYTAISLRRRTPELCAGPTTIRNAVGPTFFPVRLVRHASWTRTRRSQLRGRMGPLR